MANETNAQGLRPARRTIVKGAAWAVPAVTIASAAPVMASSPQPCVGIACVDLTGQACKHPGEPKWYHFEVCITNSSLTEDVTVTFDYMIVNGVTGTQTSPTGITVAPDTTVCTSVDSGLYDDSANGLATLYFSVDGVQGSASTGVNDLPPCGTGNDPWVSIQPKDNPPH